MTGGDGSRWTSPAAIGGLPSDMQGSVGPVQGTSRRGREFMMLVILNLARSAGRLTLNVASRLKARTSPGVTNCLLARRGSSTFPFPHSRMEAPRLHTSIPLAKIYPNIPPKHSDPK